MNLFECICFYCMLIKVHRFSVINLFYGYGFIKCHYESVLVYLCNELFFYLLIKYEFNLTGTIIEKEV